MGQAKSRGSHTQRMAQALERERAKFPPSGKCEKCQTDLPAFALVAEHNMAGINLAGKAECPACGRAAWALRGTPKAVEFHLDRLGQMYATGRSAP